MKKIFFLNYIFFFTILLLILFLTLNLKNHPIIMMIILLIYSSLICLNMSLWKSNYIYSILLFLMMISGLLIIFLYFSSLISNEQFKFNFNPYLIMMNMSLIFLMFMMTKFENMFIFKFHFQEINSIMTINSKKFINISNLYYIPLNNFTILNMFYLLISLFSIIKICSMKIMSMRKIN